MTAAYPKALRYSRRLVKLYGTEASECLVCKEHDHIAIVPLSTQKPTCPVTGRTGEFADQLPRVADPFRAKIAARRGGLKT